MKRAARERIPMTGEGQARTGGGRGRGRERATTKSEFDKPRRTDLASHCIAFVDRFEQVPPAGVSGMGKNMTQGGERWDGGRGQQGGE